MSFGWSNFVPEWEYDLGLLKGFGIPVVVSSGNTGNTSSPGVKYPARSLNVIAVGGLYPDGSHRPEASYGPELDVAAPFQTIALNNINAPVYAEGTSFAAPVISGLMALLISSNLGDGNYGSKGLGDSYPTDWTTHTCPGWNQYTGCGFAVDFYNRMARYAAKIYDLNGDCVIDVIDEALIALHYGAFFGIPLYDRVYDVMPVGGNLVISIHDLQAIFGRDGRACFGSGGWGIGGK